MSIWSNFIQNLIDRFSSKEKRVFVETQLFKKPIKKLADSANQINDNFSQLMNNERLMTKMMNLIDYMSDKGHSAYVVLINDLLVKNFKSLTKDAHHTYIRKNDKKYKKDSQESKLLARLSQVFEDNNNMKYDNSFEFMQDVSEVVNELQALRDKDKQQQKQREWRSIFPSKNKGSQSPKFKQAEEK